MDWTIILDAATGRAEALNRVVRRSSNDHAALQPLLLLEEAPHPAAALVAVATVREDLAPPIQAALAPHVAPALAAWRADPHWAERAVGDQARRNLPWGVAGLVGALRADPAALHDAVAIVVRDGDAEAVAHCIGALGVTGWRALADDRRAALLQKARVSAFGRVWEALDDAQRTTAALRAESGHPFIAAGLIGWIGAAAWRATDDPPLRRRLIDAVASQPRWVPTTAPAWAGMTAAERETLARAVIKRCDSQTVFCLLGDLGAAGRATLTADLRAALEARARTHDPWRVLALRAADVGWDALIAEERSAVLAAAEEQPRRVPDLLRAVGVAGWTAMRADEQERIAVAVRREPDALFACPPSLWGALAVAALPPATAMKDAAHHWRTEDAAADLDGLPPAHQALVLALAPWRPEDATKDSVRVRRLRAAWDALPDDERAALATVHPSVLAPIVAAARLRGGAATTIDAVGETVARRAAATDSAAAKRIVGAMLRTSDDWRAWMASFAPSAADPPEVWEAWRRAAQCGLVADVTLCARLAANRPTAAPPSRVRQRAGR